MKHHIHFLKICFAQDRYILYCSIGNHICNNTIVLGACEHEANFTKVKFLI